MVADENLVEKFPKVARYQQKVTILIRLKVFFKEKYFLKKLCSFHHHATITQKICGQKIQTKRKFICYFSGRRNNFPGGVT